MDRFKRAAEARKAGLITSRELYRESLHYEATKKEA